MKTPSALIASASGLYYGGMSLDAIQQQFRQDPAQAASKLVPIIVWNDVVIPEGAPDNRYPVRLSRRKSVKKGKPFMDATLTPIEKESGSSA